MASRENQGLQIALILFVMVTIGLAVSTFVFYKKAQEAIKESANAADDLQVITKARNKVITENSRLKKWIGHPEDEAIEQVEAVFNRDMLVFDDSVPDTNRNYRDTPKYLLTVLGDKYGEVGDARDQLRKAQDDLARLSKEDVARYDKIEMKYNEEFADWKGRRTDLEADVESAKVISRKMRTDLDTARKEKADVVETKEKEITAIAQELSKVEQVRELLAGKLNETKTETFEEPDGKIVSVNQREQTVWINLGRADNLGRQVNFSVHEKGTSSVTASARKGSVEVVRILDNHLAEARIIDSSDAQPILPGDIVYSPTWTAGRQLRFALAGLMDIEGDGKSDRTEVRNLILANNGLIDADVDELGGRSGRISIDTRYLVLGKRPTEKTASEAIQSYTAIQKEAYDLGIEKISLQKLLDMMGYEGTVRSVSLGRHARSEDHKAKPAGGAPRKSTGNTFTPRKSAY